MFVNKDSFSDALYWYQKKIGSYDQPQWEKSVEERVLNGINLNVTKKVNKLKNSLIDLDYIRGSAFNKQKPKQSWLTTTYYGIIRVIFLPFYFRWWMNQTNKKICCILLTLYLLQLCSMFIYFNNEQLNDKRFNQAIPQSEIITPLFMFFFLGILYSQIFSSSLSNHFTNRNKNYHYNLSDKLSSKDQSEEHKNKTKNSSHSELSNEESKILKSNQTLFTNTEQSINEQDSKIIKKNNKFNKLTKSRLKFKTCTTRTTRSTISKSNKYDLNKQRKRYLTASTNDSLNSIQFPNNSLKTDNLLVNKSDGDLTNKNRQQFNNELKTKELNEHTISSQNSSINQEEDDDLQINYEQNYQADNNSTSGEDCSPYSSISSSTNLKLILNKNVDEIKKQNSVEKETYFEHHIYQPKTKTKYYYFKELIDKENNETKTYTYDESQTNFKRKSISINEANEHRNNNNYSSNSSENGSISPTTPTRLNDEWPMIYEENSSEDSENEEVLINDVDDGKIEQKSIPKPAKQSTNDLLINDNVEPKNKRINSLTNKCLLTDENDLLNKPDSIDKISCTYFQNGEWQKINLSMIDISSMIIKKVDTVKYSNEYFYFAILFSLLFAFIPSIFRFQQICTNLNNTDFLQSNTVSLNNLVLNKELMKCNQEDLNILDAYGIRKNSSDECRILKNKNEEKTGKLNKSAFVCGAINSSNTTEELIEYLNYLPILIFELFIDVFKNSIYSFPLKFIVFIALIERFALSLLFFILLCVAERTYRERFLYAKFFCHLTSARRAKRNELPHFRLNKGWLSIRSFLKKHGPQRSVDSIVSTSFILAVSLLTFLCIQLLRESEILSENLYCYEMVVWVLSIGIFLLRLIILGSKMNRKYRSNLSVLITEQINLYLQLEQKPHKKEKLQLANQVLKLAADLLKQLEVPVSKISGFSANPYLYNITKVIVLSAFSAVLSEVLGFKLKLYKIKIS